MKRGREVFVTARAGDLEAAYGEIRMAIDAFSCPDEHLRRLTRISVGRLAGLIEVADDRARRTPNQRVLPSRLISPGKSQLKAMKGALNRYRQEVVAR